MEHVAPTHIHFKWDLMDLKHGENARVLIWPKPGLEPWTHSCECSWYRSRGAEPCWHIHRAFDDLMEKAPSQKKSFRVPGDFHEPCVLYPERARLAVHVRALIIAGTVPSPLALPSPSAADIRLSQLGIGVPCSNYPKDHRGLRIRTPLEQATLKRRAAEERRKRLSEDCISLSLSLSDSLNSVDGCASGSAAVPASPPTRYDNDARSGATSHAASVGSEVCTADIPAIVAQNGNAMDELGGNEVKQRRVSIASSGRARTTNPIIPTRVSVRKKKTSKVWSPS